MFGVLLWGLLIPKSMLIFVTSDSKTLNPLEIFTHGQLPWNDKQDHEVIPSIQHRDKLPKPDDCPDVVYQIMLNCWKLDSALRISSSGIVADLSNAFDAYDAVHGLIALDWPSAALTQRVSSTSTQRVAFLHSDTNIAVPRLADAEHEQYLSDATLNVYQIQLSLVQFGKELGSGEFGSVLSGTINAVDGSSTVRVALKVLKTLSDTELEGKFISEAKLFAILQHPHIVSLVAVNVLEQPWFMALELMESDLKQYLRQGTALISGNLSLLVGVCVQVADAMMFLEKRQIIHRDLAAR
jgi:hypothetical protein